MNIGNIEVKNNLFLAPMAGVTDKPFRTLCKMLGVGLTYTEMVSVKGLYYKSKKTEELLKTSKIEHPCAVQLFGHEPEIFKSVISSGVLDKFDVIDINMGCPAPKIVKNNDGSALMKDLSLASEIIKACCSATTKPITVKFRKGFKKSDDFLISFAKMCEESGASAITIHPRTREDMFSGKINLDDIKKVKSAVSIPVIGNGDVTSIDGYREMQAIADGVMIGREALKQPEIFLKILKDNNAGLETLTFFDYYNKYFNNEISSKTEVNLKNNKESFLKIKNSDIPTKKQIIKMHLALLKEEYPKEVIVKIFKKYVLSYLSGFKNATEIKKQIVLENNLDNMERTIYNFFDSI